MASAFEIFHRAERIERCAAELYRLICETVSLSAEDRALMKQLELEEVQHAARIRLLAAQYRNDARQFDLRAVDLRQLEEIERLAEDLRREVETGLWNHDPGGLKRRIGEAEDRCSHVHAELIADRTNPRVARFFRELAEQDRAHRRLLLGG